MRVILSTFESTTRWGLTFAATATAAAGVVALGWLWFGEGDPQATLPPVVAQGQASESRLPILSGSLFGVTEQQEAVSEAVSETKLNIQLKGVFPASSPDQGMAIIASSGQADGLYQAGETILRGVTLMAVYGDHIILLRSGIKEVLYFEQNEETSLFGSTDEAQVLTGTQEQTIQNAGTGVLPGSARSTYQSMSGSQSAASTRSSHPLIQDINQLSVSEMIDTYEQKFKSDPQSLLSSSGLEATGESYRVVNGSPLIGIGLRAGDEILSVNSQKVGNVAADMGLADMMRQQGVARIEMRRGDRRFFVNYPIR